MEYWYSLVFACSAALVCALPQDTNSPSAPEPFKVDIRADTNRDGQVDMEGTTDVEGKDTWTDERGALFLANIADPSGRCLTSSIKNDLESTKNLVWRLLKSRPMTKEVVKQVEDILNGLQNKLTKLAGCHDASDDIQRAPQNMATIRTLPVKGLGASASGVISVSDDAARDLVRVFRPKGDSWEMVKSDKTFSAEDLAKGLELGVDARDTRRPNVWDGRATISFTVTDGDRKSTDSVALRVAPVLTHHHGQKIERVYMADLPDSPFPVARERIEAILNEAQIQSPIIRLDTLDAWAQDIFEPAYTSMPGPNGIVAVQLLVDSAVMRERAANIVTYKSSREFGLGTVQYYGRGRGRATLDAMGNLETIPPYEHNGKKYPAGRIVVGGNEATGEVPFITDFFRAQEAQSPLILDSTWLLVQHIDEFVQFLPVNTPRGWCVMINDPKAGFEIVKQAQGKGAGKSPIISKPGGRKQSIDSFLATHINSRARDIAAERIQNTIDVLKQETGVTDNEIFRVPALVSTYEFTNSHVNFPEPKLRRRQDNDSAIEVPENSDNDFVLDTPLEAVGEAPKKSRNSTQSATSVRRDTPINDLVAFLPASVNGLVINNSTYLSPKPWGPIVNDESVFEAAVQEVYGRAGHTVKFVDDWYFHKKVGNIHCATNTLREASGSWWGQDSTQQNMVNSHKALPHQRRAGP